MRAAHCNLTNQLDNTPSVYWPFNSSNMNTWAQCDYFEDMAVVFTIKQSDILEGSFPRCFRCLSAPPTLLCFILTSFCESVFAKLLKASTDTHWHITWCYLYHNSSCHTAVTHRHTCRQHHALCLLSVTSCVVSVSLSSHWHCITWPLQLLSKIIHKFIIL